MGEKEDKWEKLINVTEDYEYDAEVADEVITKINQRESTVKFKKSIPAKWVEIAFCFLLLLIIIAFLSIYFSLQYNDGIGIYYTDDSLEYEEIRDIESFKSENGLEFKYYSYFTVESQVAQVIETNEYVYIVQNMVYIGDLSFDYITLYIVFITDAEFDFSREYNELQESIDVLGINAMYSVTENDNQMIYKAKFSYQNMSYYLEVNTEEYSDDIISKYITLLLD